VNISYTQIKEISKKGITYLDNSNNVKFIDFEICRMNWAIHVAKPQTISKLSSVSTVLKCIGERDILAKPRYFRLLENIEIIILFDKAPNLINRIFKYRYDVNEFEFLKLQSAISQMGWSTFDLS